MTSEVRYPRASPASEGMAPQKRIQTLVLGYPSEMKRFTALLPVLSLALGVGSASSACSSNNCSETATVVESKRVVSPLAACAFLDAARRANGGVQDCSAVCDSVFNSCFVADVSFMSAYNNGMFAPSSSSGTTNSGSVPAVCPNASDVAVTCRFDETRPRSFFAGSCPQYVQ
jgi:hypothetical protein